MKLITASHFPSAMTSASLSDVEQLVTVALKVTASLEQGRLVPVPREQQWPVFEAPAQVEGVDFAEELHFGRTAVDVRVLGSAHAPRGARVTAMRVGVSSGEWRFEAAVFGDRRWTRGSDGGELFASEPEPFTSMPLTCERAFGGKALLDGLEAPFAMNPLGRGFYASAQLAEGAPLPNVERPDALVRRWDDHPRPACFVMPPSSSMSTGMQYVLGPDGLPTEPTRRFFQTAAPDLVAPLEHLGETLTLEGFSPDGALVFPLPRQGREPVVRATIGERQSAFRLRLAAVTVLADSRSIVLTFRRSFRYLYAPKQDPRRVELTWTDVDAVLAAPSDRVRADIPSPRPPEVLPTARQPAPPTPSTGCLFTASPDGRPQLLYALRQTYRLDDRGRLTLADEQLPLPDDYVRYDDVSAGVSPSCRSAPEGVFKTGTDVVVQGFAHTYGRPVDTLDVGVRVAGRWGRTARVFGRRVCEVRGGSVAFSAPERFETMALRYENAYGGRDARAERAWLETISALSRARASMFLPEGFERASPFVYPRNPSGKGFVVGPDLDCTAGRELPNLEDPDDLLTPDRFRCESPERWPAQPVPVGFDYLDIGAFPRSAMLGCCPEHSLDDFVFAEARRGFVAADFIRPSVFALPPTRMAESVHPDASRCASPGLSVPYLTGAETIELTHIDPSAPRRVVMLPDHTPRFAFRHRGRSAPAEARIVTVLIEPELARVSVVWCGGITLDRLPVPHELDASECAVEWRSR